MGVSPGKQPPVSASVPLRGGVEAVAAAEVGTVMVVLRVPEWEGK